MGKLTAFLLGLCCVAGIFYYCYSDKQESKEELIRSRVRASINYYEWDGDYESVTITNDNDCDILIKGRVSYGHNITDFRVDIIDILIPPHTTRTEAFSSLLKKLPNRRRDTVYLYAYYWNNGFCGVHAKWSLARSSFFYPD